MTAVCTCKPSRLAPYYVYNPITNRMMWCKNEEDQKTLALDIAKALDDDADVNTIVAGTVTHIMQAKSMERPEPDKLTGNVDENGFDWKNFDGIVGYSYTPISIIDPKPCR